MIALVLVPREWLQTAPERRVRADDDFARPFGYRGHGRHDGHHEPARAGGNAADAKPVTTPPGGEDAEMVAPAPDVKPKPVTKPVKKPIEQSATKKPSTGPELKSGAGRVVAPNAAQVPFGGLAERAGGSSAGGPKLDVANFCCPEYIETMTQRIRSNWDQQQGAAGQTIVKFTIRRDGMLTNVEVEKSSNNPLLDLESRRAVLSTRQLPPLPEQFDSTDVDRVPHLRLQALNENP